MSDRNVIDRSINQKPITGLVTTKRKSFIRELEITSNCGPSDFPIPEATCPEPKRSLLQRRTSSYTAPYELTTISEDEEDEITWHSSNTMRQPPAIIDSEQASRRVARGSLFMTDAIWPCVGTMICFLARVIVVGSCLWVTCILISSVIRFDSLGTMNRPFRIFIYVCLGQVVFSLMLTGVAIILKWLVIGQHKPGRYPIYGSYYWRWLLVRGILDIPQLYLLYPFHGTRVMWLYYYLLGARRSGGMFTGASCIVRSGGMYEVDLVDFPPFPSAVYIEDNAMISCATISKTGFLTLRAMPLQCDINVTSTVVVGVGMLCSPITQYTITTHEAVDHNRSLETPTTSTPHCASFIAVVFGVLVVCSLHGIAATAAVMAGITLGAFGALEYQCWVVLISLATMPLTAALVYGILLIVLQRVFFIPFCFYVDTTGSGALYIHWLLSNCQQGPLFQLFSWFLSSSLSCAWFMRCMGSSIGNQVMIVGLPVTTSYLDITIMDNVSVGSNTHIRTFHGRGQFRVLFASGCILQNDAFISPRANDTECCVETANIRDPLIHWQNKHSPNADGNESEHIISADTPQRQEGCDESMFRLLSYNTIRWLLVDCSIAFCALSCVWLLPLRVCFSVWDHTTRTYPYFSRSTLITPLVVIATTLIVCAVFSVISVVHVVCFKRLFLSYTVRVGVLLKYDSSLYSTWSITDNLIALVDHLIMATFRGTPFYNMWLVALGTADSIIDSAKGESDNHYRNLPMWIIPRADSHLHGDVDMTYKKSEEIVAVSRLWSCGTMERNRVLFQLSRLE